MKRDQRGFVLSGTALLLVLPAMLLTASCLKIVGMGGEAVSLQVTADKVYYTGRDLARVLENMWASNILADNRHTANARFDNLVDNYNVATGLLVNFTENWKLWTYYVQGDDVEYVYAGTYYCKVARGVGDNWFYYMDSYHWMADWNDITLRVQKIGDNLLITIYDFDPGADIWVVQPIDVYWGSTLIFDDVRSPTRGIHPTVGDSYQENGNITQLTASFNIQDPRGAARYSGSENLG